MKRLALIFGASLLAFPAGGATLSVTNTNDSGAGSLRQAILDSNASVGVLDTIAFAIPGAGVHTITPASALPIVTDPVAIDGTTQPGYGGTPLIELAGVGLGANGLEIAAGASTVTALAVNGFSVGIWLRTVGGNTVEGCFIGTDPTGTQAHGNGTGIWISAASGNTVGGSTPAARNLISGNTGIGISLDAAPGTVVAGNFVGTDVTGTLDLGNGSVGIYSQNASDDALIGGTAGTTPGGPCTGACNLVSGNQGGGINIWGGFAGNARVIVQGNFVGTDVTGTQALGNGNFGVQAGGGSSDAVIGGTSPSARNVISGSGSTGVFLGSGGASGNVVQGNLIGTAASGTLPLSNGSYGVSIQGSSNNTIGGPAAGEGNVIAFHPLDGVYLYNATGNTIRGNSIFENGGLGVELFPTGVTANDPGDADTGTNDLQNWPVLASVEPAAPQGGSTRFQGVLHSAPSTTYDLDFYENPPCTPFLHEFVEGHTYLGAGQVMTDATGYGIFDVTLPVSVSSGARISATATDPAGNTSEFSQRIVFSLTPAAGPAGGANVTIAGSDFAAGASVTIGGQAATNVVVSGFNSITATTPAFAAGTSHDVTVANADGSTGTLVKGWVADFLDVPQGQQFHNFVVTLVSNGITAGIGGGLYGVNDNTLRQQMAVFLLKGKLGLCYAPPPCTGVFGDVVCPSIFADWIEALAAEGITGGCGGGNYCPQNPVRRDQMAVFLLKAEHGSAYQPPSCTGAFSDVPCPGQFADWIEQLAAELITGGCGGGNYCPLNPNTRGQMAVFITKTFGLQ